MSERNRASGEWVRVATYMDFVTFHDGLVYTSALEKSGFFEISNK